LFAFIGFGLVLSGCTGSQWWKPSWWDDRYGPQPVVGYTDLKTSTDNSLDVMQTLLLRTGNPSSTWADVMMAGFTYVDEKCSAYLKDIFVLSREKSRIVSGITFADKAAGAILTASHASATALAVTAQSFGLGENLSGAFFDSYLFSVDPGHIVGLVQKTQAAYKKAALTNKDKVTTWNDAYQQIQGYLSLCLPPTIDATIAGLIAGAEATPTTLKPVKQASAASSSQVTVSSKTTSGGVTVKAATQVGNK
jgi:hypothetical protein